MMNWIKGDMELSKVQLLCVLVLSSMIFAFKSDDKKVSELNNLVDNWHLAASNADFDSYFEPTTDDFMFLGTAPGEEWSKEEFMAFSKPYFDKGKAWSFKSISRKFMFSKNGKTAYFYENLDTWMKDCRGSGVLEKVKGEWKLSLYNLTVLIENEKMDAFLELREEK